MINSESNGDRVSAWKASQATGVDIFVVKWLCRVGAVKCDVTGAGVKLRYHVDVADLRRVVGDLTTARHERRRRWRRDPDWRAGAE